MPTARVIDLSHHNVVPESLRPAAAAGIWACIHKCTEGTTYADPKYAARRWLADDTGMLWGAYHFLRPAKTHGSMLSQANFFVRAAGEGANALVDGQGSGARMPLLAADHEDAGVSLDDLADFLQAVQDLTDTVPVIYSGHVLKEQLAAAGGKGDAWLCSHRLWLAQYTSGTPTLPPGFDKYWLWQFTDKGSVAGVTPPTDLNAYWPERSEDRDGSREDLQDEWLRRVDPTPEPAPEQAVVRVIVPPGVRVVVEEG